MSIEAVEQFSGEEIERWKLHFARVPFRWELDDFAQANMCQKISGAFGGKAKALRKYLLINRPKDRQSGEKMIRTMKAALGG